MAKTKSYNLFLLLLLFALMLSYDNGLDKEKTINPNLTGIVINDVNPDSLLRKKDKSINVV